MAQSLRVVLKQIEQLQKTADALRAREKADVVGRIREAISHYEITADDLFGEPAKARRRTAVKPGAAATKVPAKKASGKKTKGKGRAVANKKPGVPKYTDGAGRTWTGFGKRPGWFNDALAGGKQPEELLIKA